MSIRNTLVAAMIAAAALLPSRSDAQIAIGGFVGREFDVEEDWLLFGAELRIGIANFPFTLNPRVSHQSFEGGAVTQIDINAVHDLRLANQGTFLPFLGLGAAIVRDSFDDDAFETETNTGLNIIAGSRIVFSRGSPVMGVVQTQYTSVEDYPNRYVLTIGLLVRLSNR